MNSYDSATAYAVAGLKEGSVRAWRCRGILPGRGKRYTRNDLLRLTILAQIIGLGVAGRAARRYAEAAALGGDTVAFGSGAVRLTIDVPALRQTVAARLIELAVRRKLDAP